MESNFRVFGDAVRNRFMEMSVGRLFVVDSDRDEIWRQYLAGFPAGTNPFFRKTTEHDCSCCRHFIRAVGDVVTIKDGVIGTIWDVTGLPSHFQAVADAMAAYIRSRTVCDLFLTKFKNAGQEFSIELKDGTTTRWNHFSAIVPKHLLCDDPDTKRGAARASHAVFKRGVEELTPSAIASVLDLIEGNALYRGAEFKSQLLEFQSLQAKVRGGNGLLLWELLESPAARLRNSVIGTLLQDLSEGVELERAVKSFETKVAPSNYKRPTALITPRMIEESMKTITELDLEPALQRRHARLSDVSVNSVLWVDNSVRGKLRGGLAGKLMEEVKPAAFDPKDAKPISIDEFLGMQHKNGIRLYLDNALLPNFVSMTAPAHPESKSLFKWSNDFAWSYEGNVTDSIKDKVKRAGGQVEGVALRASLAWFNTDDLDLHCDSPQGLLYFGNARPHILDVDMNVGGESREPVENMRWRIPPNGVYRFMVNNYRRREPVDVGFVLEVESVLGIHTFRFANAVGDKQTIPVCTVTVRSGQVVEISKSAVVTAGAMSHDQWGLKTLDLVKVNAIVQSPNYWDGNAVGNKHWFFILEGCKNPEPCRGIYNEFLHSRLEQHRKVFEVLGAKTKCPVADEQLSGVGFSSTRKDQVVVTSNGVAYAIRF